METLGFVLICLGAILVFVVLVLIPLAIKIVREYQRIVVFRLGKCVGAKGPGMVIIIPIVDTVAWVDLREQFQ